MGCNDFECHAVAGKRKFSNHLLLPLISKKFLSSRQHTTEHKRDRNRLDRASMPGEACLTKQLEDCAHQSTDKAQPRAQTAKLKMRQVAPPHLEPANGEAHQRQTAPAESLPHKFLHSFVAKRGHGVGFTGASAANPTPPKPNTPMAVCNGIYVLPPSAVLASFGTTSSRKIGQKTPLQPQSWQAVV